MTIHHAIARVDLLHPNDLSVDVKIRLLSDLDKKIMVEIIGKDVDDEKPLYDRYTDRNTELLVPFPFDDIYIKYIAAMISGKIWFDSFNSYRDYYERKCGV